MTVTTATTARPTTSLWADIRTTIGALFGAVVATARTTEKAVSLVENEVDNLNELQMIRLDEVKNDRRVQLAALTRTPRKPSKKKAA